MPITRSQRSKIIGYEKDLGLLRLSAIIRCSEERPASLVWAPLPTQEPLVNTNLLTFIDFEKWTLNVDLAHSFQGQFCSKIFWQDKLGKLCRPVYLDPKRRRNEFFSWVPRLTSIQLFMFQPFNNNTDFQGHCFWVPIAFRIRPRS